MNLTGTVLFQDFYVVVNRRTFKLMFIYFLLLFLYLVMLWGDRYLNEWKLRTIFLSLFLFVIKVQLVLLEKLLFQLILIPDLFFSLFVAIGWFDFFLSQPLKEPNHIFRSYLVNSRLLGHWLIILLRNKTWQSFSLWRNHWILFTEFFCLLWKAGRRTEKRGLRNGWGLGRKVEFVLVGLGKLNSLLERRMMIEGVVKSRINGVKGEYLMVMKVGAECWKVY